MGLGYQAEINTRFGGHGGHDTEFEITTRSNTSRVKNLECLGLPELVAFHYYDESGGTDGFCVLQGGNADLAYACVRYLSCWPDEEVKQIKAVLDAAKSRRGLVQDTSGRWYRSKDIVALKPDRTVVLALGMCFNHRAQFEGEVTKKLPHLRPLGDAWVHLEAVTAMEWEASNRVGLLSVPSSDADHALAIGSAYGHDDRAVVHVGGVVLNVPMDRAAFDKLLMEWSTA